MKVDQRQTLATLSKAQLREIAESFELAVPGTLRKDALIELLARSRRASFERILETLKRAGLKGICRVAGLDDSGREKAAIIDRILDREALAAQPGEAPVPAPYAAGAAVAPARGPAAHPGPGRRQGAAPQSGHRLVFTHGALWKHPCPSVLREPHPIHFLDSCRDHFR